MASASANIKGNFSVYLSFLCSALLLIYNICIRLLLPGKPFLANLLPFGAWIFNDSMFFVFLNIILLLFINLGLFLLFSKFRCDRRIFFGVIVITANLAISLLFLDLSATLIFGYLSVALTYAPLIYIRHIDPFKEENILIICYKKSECIPLIHEEWTQLMNISVMGAITAVLSGVASVLTLNYALFHILFFIMMSGIWAITILLGISKFCHDILRKLRLQLNSVSNPYDFSELFKGGS